MMNIFFSVGIHFEVPTRREGRAKPATHMRFKLLLTRQLN